MFAEVDWAVLVPSTITSLTGLAVVIMTYLTRRTVQEIAPAVQAIDRAVNGQPPGTPPLVDKVAEIIIEQNRVAGELAEHKGGQ